MYQIEVERLINQIISFFYRVRFWRQEGKESVWERRIKFCFSVYCLLFPVSLLVGSLTSDNNEDMILSFEACLIQAVQLIKLSILIRRKEEFLELLNRICVYVIDDHNTFNLVSNESNIFVKYVTVYFSLSSVAILTTICIVPFLGSEKTLFLNIGFPLDYKNDELAYWVAFSFFVTEIVITAVTLLSNVLIWYLMFNFGLRYMVLGVKFKNIGSIKQATETSKKRKVSDAERDNMFLQDLHEAISEHTNLNTSTKHLDVFLSEIFVAQLTTSGICICCSIYSLAFNRGKNLFETMIQSFSLLYNVFDIFLISYFGNNIRLESDRLSYRLFESDWVDRSQSIKKELIIFGEFLMKPAEFVVLKLYSLTLETFTRIINSAYSMFNILKTFK